MITTKSYLICTLNLHGVIFTLIVGLENPIFIIKGTSFDILRHDFLKDE